jgi:hypothetical protein
MSNAAIARAAHLVDPQGAETLEVMGSTIELPTPPEAARRIRPARSALDPTRCDPAGA